MKTCAKCGTPKPTTEFRKDAKRNDGLRVYCKACVCIADAAYRSANKDRAASYRAANRAKVNLATAAWRAANPDKTREYDAKYRLANIDKVKAKNEKWQADNKSARRVNEQNRRARKRHAGGSLSKGLSDRLFKLQSGKCACGCKQPLGDNYHLDHIMPLALGGTNTDDNIQLLTSACNQHKHAKHPIDFMQQRGFLI